MKSWKALVCVLAMLAAVPAAELQAAEDFSVCNIGIGCQYWNAKDLDEFDADGMFGLNLILRIRPIKYLGIDLRIGGEGAWEGETIRVDGRRYDTDVVFGCVPAEAGLVLMLPVGDVVTLYGGGGVGYYYYDLDVESHTHHRHSRWEHDDEHIKMEDDVGWYALVGLNFQLCPHFSVFVEGRYTDTATKFKHPEDYGLSESENEDIDISGVGGQIGLMFDF